MKKYTIIILVALSTSLVAQDTISLTDCHNLAMGNAPRVNDRDIIQKIGELKIENTATNWYPSMELNGRVSYQSDVVTVALANAAIPVEFPEVPHDQYGLNIDFSQTLYDGGITSQKKRMEQATSEAELQQVEVDLYQVKSHVNQIYFAILLLQENGKNLHIHLDNLEKRYAVLKTAFEQGTILETDLKVLEVEQLKIDQNLLATDARKQALLSALKVICGSEIHNEIHLKIPENGPIEGDLGNRPEYQWFDLKQASMEAGKELLSKKRMPVLFAFGQTGYGKPGYNMLSDEWDFYYRVGAGLRWNIWDWNQSDREQQVIESQQLILKNQRSSFDQKIFSLLVQEEANIKHYNKSMELDRKVLELQKEISEHAATKLANGTIIATDYITELNKESVARINLASHRIQLAQSITNYLTIQGNL